MWIVAIGDAFDGITLYGPFDECEDATEWADNHTEDREWTVVQINAIDGE